MQAFNKYKITLLKKKNKKQKKLFINCAFPKGMQISVNIPQNMIKWSN